MDVGCCSTLTVGGGTRPQGNQGAHLGKAWSTPWKRGPGRTLTCGGLSVQDIAVGVLSRHASTGGVAPLVPPPPPLRPKVASGADVLAEEEDRYCKNPLTRRPSHLQTHQEPTLLSAFQTLDFSWRASERRRPHSESVWARPPCRGGDFPYPRFGLAADECTREGGRWQGGGGGGVGATVAAAWRETWT
jgi:hypothetical protein